MLDFFAQSTTTGQLGVVRIADGRVQPWPLAIRPDLYLESLTRLPDGHLLVALQHAVDVAAGTCTGGGTLCSADDGATRAQVC